MREYTRLNVVTLYSILSPRVDCYVLLNESATLSLLLHFKHYFSRAIIVSNILPTNRCGSVSVPHSTIFSRLQLVVIVCSSLPYHTGLGIMEAMDSVNETWDVNKLTNV